MEFEKNFLELDKELEKAKKKIKAKKEKLKVKAEKKSFSNIKLLERELKKGGLEVEKPLYEMTREEVVALAEKILSKPTKNFEEFDINFGD